MRVNQRGWTPLNENDPIWEDENHYDEVKPKADKLAQLWSALHHEDEQEGFARQANFEDGFQDYDYDPDDEETFKQWEYERQLKIKLREAQMDTLEEELTALGVRLMRPYEHHNEMESYYAYMERDR